MVIKHYNMSGKLIELNIDIPTSEFIFFVIQIICYWIYFMLVIFLIYKLNRHRTTKSSFEFHFVSNFPIDMFQIFQILVFTKCFRWGLFLNLLVTNKIIHKLYTLSYPTILGSLFGNTIILINKYCALANPIFYNTKWRGKICYIIVLIQYVSPFLIYIFDIINNPTLGYSPRKKLIIFFFRDKSSEFINNCILASFAGLAGILSIILNIITIKKYNKAIRNSSSKEKSKEITLIINMLITSISVIALSIQQTTRLTFTLLGFKDGLYMLPSYLYWILNVNVAIKPFVVLVLSKSIRQGFLRFYFGRIYFYLCKDKKNNFHENVFPFSRRIVLN
uniref:Serpentine receptor class gamma n=1 Tax=Parastrongyloides trichosuri TaxID=131310 RepID=A0A0N5A4N1_PARTI